LLFKLIMTLKKHTTETDSLYQNLEQKSTLELLTNINYEDNKVADCIENELESIVKATEAILNKMAKGGRLFYIGSGTSGRLGVVDASECPPTFGVPHGLVVGIIAGGDIAIRKAVENAEDDTEQGWKDLQKENINEYDFVLGISASGSTPYVLGALKKCAENGVKTGIIACNKNCIIGHMADYKIEIEVGPEFVTGSTRMKSGTAQKLVLNMISTTVMIKLGKVEGNKMVDMQLSNKKLVDRGTKMIMEQTQLDYENAESLLLRQGSVRNAIAYYNKEK
jgi:N-acetylmuramic acid 6-phosphate etherase